MKIIIGLLLLFPTLIHSGTMPDLKQGGTNQTSWTAGTCIRINAAGDKFESAPADCRVAVNLGSVADCTGATDSRSAVQSLITSLGARAYYFPENCTPKFSDPGDGNAAITLPSFSSLICEPGAILNVDKKVCVGGTYAGAACTTGTDCTGGSCVGTVFAASGNTSTLIRGATSSANIEIIGCDLNAQGIDGWYTCNGGSAAGLPCGQVCSNDATKRCTESGQCGAGTCTLDTRCSGGSCNNPSGIPAGNGTINLIDLSSTTDALVKDVTIKDYRKGGIGIQTGANGVVTASKVGLATYTYANAYQQDAYDAISVSTSSNVNRVWTYAPKGLGVVAANQAQNVIVSDSRISGDISNSNGLYLGPSGTSTNNRIENHKICVWGTPESTTTGNQISLCSVAGVQLCGPGSIVTGNWIGYSTGVVAGNSTITSCSGVSHNSIANNFIGSLFGGAGFNLVSSTRCLSGTNAGKLCPGGAGDCPSGTCGTPTFDSTKIVGNFWFLQYVDFTGMTGTGTIYGNSLEMNTVYHTGHGFVFPTTAAAMNTQRVFGNNCQTLSSSVPCFENWVASMGDMGLNFGLNPSDEQPRVGYLFNKDGAASLPGDPWTVDSSTANSAKGAAANSTNIVGVVMNTANDASVIQLALPGSITTCNTTTTSVGIGVRLKVGATAKKFVAASDAERAFAYTLGSSVDKTTYRQNRCLVIYTPGTAAAPSIYSTSAAPGTSFGSTASTVYTVFNIAATPFIGGKNAIISFTVQDNDSGSGAETILWQLYRATTSCPSVGATTPTGTLLSPTAGFSITPASGGATVQYVTTLTFLDTSTVATTTNYCLVATRTGGSNNHTLRTVTAVATELP